MAYLQSECNESLERCLSNAQEEFPKESIKAYVQEELEELNQFIVKATADFLETDKRQREMAESMKNNEAIYKRLINVLEEHEDFFFQRINNVLENFKKGWFIYD